MKIEDLPEPVWQWREIEDGEEHNIGEIMDALTEIHRHRTQELTAPKILMSGVWLCGHYYSSVKNSSGIFAVSRSSKTISLVMYRRRPDGSLPQADQGTRPVMITKRYVGSGRVLFDLPDWELLKPILKKIKIRAKEREKNYQEWLQTKQ